MRVLEHHHSHSFGLCCWFERKYTIAIFFLNVNIAFKVYILMILGISFVSCHYRRFICLASLSKEIKISESVDLYRD